MSVSTRLPSTRLIVWITSWSPPRLEAVFASRSTSSGSAVSGIATTIVSCWRSPEPLKTWVTSLPSMRSEACVSGVDPPPIGKRGSVLVYVAARNFSPRRRDHGLDAVTDEAGDLLIGRDVQRLGLG